MEDNRTKLYNLLVLIISGLALFISGISLYFSYDANSIAEESLYQTTRPRIQLSPAELPNGEYFFVEERDNKFHIKIQLVVHNSGLTPATDISYIKEITELNILDEELSLSSEPAKTSPSIGPSREYFRMFSYVLEPKNYSPEKKEKVFSLIRNKDFIVNLDVIIQYHDEKSENRHTTYASYKFTKSNVIVLEYEEK